jgi:ParB family chromosome partitioning protein
LREEIERDGGSVLAVFRDPLGGLWQIFAALPLDRVEPTPFQRDLSEAHAKRLTNVIDGLGRFLDPIIAVRKKDGGFWTPNGHHRLSAMRRLGARSIVALVLPEAEVAYRSSRSTPRRRTTSGSAPSRLSAWHGTSRRRRRCLKRTTPSSSRSRRS